jgi:hypothetical protein
MGQPPGAALPGVNTSTNELLSGWGSKVGGDRRATEGQATEGQAAEGQAAKQL